MQEGYLLLIILVVAVLFVVVSSAAFKLHPFLGLLLSSLFVGIAVGMPLQEVTDIINQGFGSIMAHIGLIVVLGSIIGTILERSGAAIRIADLVVAGMGKKRPSLAMSFLGALVGIPVFCDSGFIILSGLAKVVARKTGASSGSLSLGLAAGLYTTHTLVPPTPGPIAAAGNLGGAAYLGTIILTGILIAIPTLLVAYWLAERLGKNLETNKGGSNENFATDPTLPSPVQALAPILLPILLIALGSIARFAQWEGHLAAGILFLGQPLIALLAGLVAAIPLMGKLDEEHLSGWIGKGIGQAGPILLLTGAGGAFGAVLKATPIAALMENWVTEMQLGGWFFLVVAFVVAALLKTSQGSSTSALVITSGMLAPLVVPLGMDTAMGYALLVMAMGGGAMTISHANDSFFWVVSQFSGLSMKDAYRSYTLITLAQGVTVLLCTLAIYAFT